MTQPDQEPTEPPRGPVRQLRVRRSPRYGAFLGTGAALGLLIALVSGATGPVDAQTGRANLIGYLAMTLMLLGALVGAGVAVALERFSGRSRIDGRGDTRRVEDRADSRDDSRADDRAENRVDSPIDAERRGG